MLKNTNKYLILFLSKEGSGWQWCPKDAPVEKYKRSQLRYVRKIKIEKKFIKTISKSSKWKTNQLRQFPKNKIEKKSIETDSTNPNRKEIN